MSVKQEGAELRRLKDEYITRIRDWINSIEEFELDPEAGGVTEFEALVREHQIFVNNIDAYENGDLSWKEFSGSIPVNLLKNEIFRASYNELMSTYEAEEIVSALETDPERLSEFDGIQFPQTEQIITDSALTFTGVLPPAPVTTTGTPSKVVIRGGAGVVIDMEDILNSVDLEDLLGSMVPYIPGIPIPDWLPTAGVIFFPKIQEGINKVREIIAETGIEEAIEEGDLGEIIKDIGAIVVGAGGAAAETVANKVKEIYGKVVGTVTDPTKAGGILGTVIGKSFPGIPDWLPPLILDPRVYGAVRSVLTSNFSTPDEDFPPLDSEFDEDPALMFTHRGDNYFVNKTEDEYFQLAESEDYTFDVDGLYSREELENTGLDVLSSGTYQSLLDDYSFYALTEDIYQYPMEELIERYEAEGGILPGDWDLMDEESRYNFFLDDFFGLGDDTTAGSRFNELMASLQAGEYVYGDAGEAYRNGEITQEELNQFTQAFDEYTGTTRGDRPFQIGDVVGPASDQDTDTTTTALGYDTPTSSTAYQVGNRYFDNINDARQWAIDNGFTVDDVAAYTTDDTTTGEEDTDTTTGEGLTDLESLFSDYLQRAQQDLFNSGFLTRDQLAEALSGLVTAEQLDQVLQGAGFATPQQIIDLLDSAGFATQEQLANALANSGFVTEAQLSELSSALGLGFTTAQQERAVLQQAIIAANGDITQLSTDMQQRFNELGLSLEELFAGVDVDIAALQQGQITQAEAFNQFRTSVIDQFGLAQTERQQLAEELINVGGAVENLSQQSQQRFNELGLTLEELGNQFNINFEALQQGQISQAEALSDFSASVGEQFSIAQSERQQLAQELINVGGAVENLSLQSQERFNELGLSLQELGDQFNINFEALQQGQLSQAEALSNFSTSVSEQFALAQEERQNIAQELITVGGFVENLNESTQQRFNELGLSLEELGNQFNVNFLALQEGQTTIGDELDNFRTSVGEQFAFSESEAERRQQELMDVITYQGEEVQKQQALGDMFNILASTGMLGGGGGGGVVTAPPYEEFMQGLQYQPIQTVPLAISTPALTYNPEAQQIARRSPRKGMLV